MPEHAPTAALAAAAGGIVDLSFFGPVGTLISTFLRARSAVLTQAANAVDQQRRGEAIQTALIGNEPKIAEAGEQLADAIDAYVAATRHRLARLIRRATRVHPEHADRLEQGREM